MKTEKLYPVTKNYIWGGERLVRQFGKKSELPCAESWELSFHPDGVTELSDKTKLRDAVGAADLGENCARFSDFPMMVKLIDAEKDLSVQVHPTDGYAEKLGAGQGKTEMWYVVECAPGACLYVGFKRKTDKETVRRAALDGSLPSLLNRIEVKPGDAYLIPAGTVHAIGAGCLVCEIQQNSNITYRLYDYGRTGADGKPRELHLDRALDVLDTGTYSPVKIDCAARDGRLLFASRNFTAYRLAVDGGFTFLGDRGSFRCVTCVSGTGSLDGVDFSRGDSLFIPADGQTHECTGKAELIVSSVRRYAVGIDLGGTFIKGGIADDLGNIIISDKIETRAEEGADAVGERIAELALSLCGRCGLKTADLCGVGIGVPGMIDREKGEVVYSNNLKWSHFPVKERVGALTGMRVSICNDANVAALGEARFGAGEGVKNVVMLTLGTGVGGGMILDGRLYEGNSGAGAELGHLVVVKDGVRCTCGRRGCLEAYASATGLIRMTKEAIAGNPDCAMAKAEKIDGSTAFAYRDTDPAARRVVEEYISYLGEGAVDIANVFRPQILIIGGGVGKEGEKITGPLQKIVDSNMFGGELGPRVRVVPAALGNRAGILGAAALIF